MELKRFQTSWSEDCSDLAYIRKHYTVTGNPTPSTMGYGKCLNFDGSDTFNITNEVKGFLDYSTNFTINIRVDFTNTSANQGLIGSNIASNVGPIRCVTAYTGGNNYPRFELVGNSGNYAMNGTTVLNDGTEYILSFIKEGDNFKIYVNGVLDTSTDFTFGTTKAIGANEYLVGFAGYYYSSSKMKDVVVDNRAWTVQELLDFSKGTTFDYDKNLISEWDMSNTGTVPDIGWKGNENNGTTVNMDLTNVKENGLKFNGSNEYITTPLTIDVNEQYTFSWWCISDIYGGASSWIGGNGSNCIQIRNSGLNIQVLDGGSGSDSLATTSSPLVVGEMQHIAVVWDGITSIGKIYVDGHLEKEGVIQPGTYLNRNMYIAGSFNGQYFNGLINYVKVYNGLLTYTQVKDLNKRFKK